MLGVSLPNRDRADKVSVELEFGFRERIRHYGSLGQFAREPGRPVLGGLVHLCFPRGAGGYFRGCEAARLGKVFEKSPETESVVRVPVGDVDASDALAETLGPLCQGVCLTIGHQGVNKDRLILAGDQGAAHRGPGRVVAGPLGWVACVGGIGVTKMSTESGLVLIVLLLGSAERQYAARGFQLSEACGLGGDD